MPMKSATTYSPLHRALHWLMAIMIVGMLCVGFYIHSLDAQNPAEEPTKSALGALHKATGMVILLLVTMRISLLYRNGKPPLPEAVPAWQKKAAKISHALLYVLMFGMPISGYVMSSFAGRPVSMYGLFEIAPMFAEKNMDMAKAVFGVHETLAWTLLALVVIHICAALRHHFIQKDFVLRRMLLGKTD